MARKGSRGRWWLIAAVAVFVVYTIVGFFVVPPIARSQIEKQAGAALKREVTVEKVRFNPLVFSASVEGLRVADRDGGELTSWRLAYVNFDPLTSLFRREWHLGEVRLVEPKQRLVIAADGALNVADLLGGENEGPPEAEGAAKSPLPAVGVGVLSIEGWSLAFSDHTHRAPFKTVVGPMTFELADVTTRPNEKGPYSFHGTTDTGETFSWSGTVGVEPLASAGHIEFSGVSLPKHAPYAENFHHAEVRSGTVSVSASYDISLGDVPVARASGATVAIDGLALATPGEADPAVSFSRFEVNMPSADLLARTATIARAALSGLSVAVERREDGSIDLLDWLPRQAAATETGESSPAESADRGPAPSIRIERAELTDARVRITDRTTPQPATLALDQISFVVTNTGTDLDQETGIEANLRWAGLGTIAAKGIVRAQPLAASIDVDAENLSLAPLEPYLAPFADARIKSGAARAIGHAQIAQARGEPLAVTWSGDAGVGGLAVADGKLGADLVSWKNLSLHDTQFTLAPLKFSAKEIALEEPVVTVAVARDGSSNIGAALRREPAAAQPAAEATPDATTPPAVPTKTAAGTSAPAKTARRSDVVAEATQQSLPFAASIDAITISGGRFGLNDRSVGSGFTTELRDFSGAIRGLSSENLARADVDLSARLDGAAPLRITGSINPLAEDKFSDVTVVFSNIDLPAFSPYAGRYLGQKIQKGKLRVDLGYKLSKNQLAGENHVLFDQFYLGEKVESPDALKLPIGLALALLRDREGRIDLDVPVRGNLDDPDFKYGRVVWKAIGNIILKAATSPFSMLGGLLGGRARDTDLSYVDFASGSVELSEATADKLVLLAKALYERPGLRLEIKAPPSPDGDRGGLHEARFAALLDAERQQIASSTAAMEAPGATAEPAGTAVGDDELVGRLFTRLFPDEAERVLSIVETGPSAGSSEVPAETEVKPGAVGRFFRSLFGGGGEPKTAAQTDTVAHADAKPATAESEAAAGAPQALPPLTVAEMRARILDTIELTDADFHELASTRARFIRDRLLVGGQIEPERVFLTDSAAIPDGATAATEGARVFFGLQ